MESSFLECRLRRIVQGLLLLLLSIGCKTNGKQDYVRTVLSARQSFALAKEMEQQFPVADHFITHYGMRSGQPLIWNTEVFFGDRYVLTMQAKIRIDYKKDEFEVTEDPKFFLHEIKSFQGKPAVVGANHEFSLTEWKKLVAAKFDWSVIAIPIEPKAATGFDSYVRGTRRPRMQISLTGKP